MEKGKYFAKKKQKMRRKIKKAKYIVINEIIKNSIFNKLITNYKVNF